MRASGRGPRALLGVLALVVVGALLVGFLSSAGGPSADVGSMQSRPWDGSAPTSLSGTSRPSANCSDGGLASLSVTPRAIRLLPLDVQWFSAVAENSCSVSLTHNVTFSWWLSSVSLGTLNGTGGGAVAYTACVAPMSGVLHLKAVSNQVTLFANATISVTGHASGDPNATSVVSGAGAGGAGGLNFDGVPVGSVGIMAGLIVLAATALYLGRRRGPGGKPDA